MEAVRSQLTEAVKGDSLKVSQRRSIPCRRRCGSWQATFEETGGLHAAGLFEPNGKLVECREDVGRHNALDKLIGSQFLRGHLRREDFIVLVSGRTSFELVQKVVSAGIPMLVAVGAPSSLAVDLAEEFGVTLVGFASEKRFNVYSHAHRVDFDA